PWFPDIFGWVSGQLYYSWTAGGLNAPRAFPGIASIMVGFVCINTNPVCAAVAFLAPMDVQLSVWVFNIIFIWIIPQIAYAMGYYSGILSQFDNWARSSRFQTQFPLMYEAFSSVGGSLALFTSWFFLNRKYLSSTI
ncbi:MAG: hypothetical protein QXH91_05510, partial [Candidatus Bathyarchaeia archaeon]